MPNKVAIITRAENHTKVFQAAFSAKTSPKVKTPLINTKDNPSKATLVASREIPKKQAQSSSP
ncbi:TPA: hypothetical protein SE183_001253 [Campylobacter jejuni]|nr:hypothetical protein [Campylobacter jejuni]